MADFNWVDINSKIASDKDSIYYDKDNSPFGYPTKDNFTNYGLLNILDHYLDILKGEDTKYSIDNALNTFLLDLWDFLKEIDANKIKQYYLAIVDSENYLYSLMRYKVKTYIINNNDNETFREELTKLFEILVYRGDFQNQGNDTQDFTECISEEDKKPNYDKNYSINVYILKNNNTEETLLDKYTTINNMSVQDYCTKYSSDASDSRMVFNYITENDFNIDSFNETTNGKSKLFELLDAARKSLESYKNDSNYINYYELYFKNYFYKTLVEKYRTKNIEDALKQELKYTDPGYEKVIQKVYAKLNGKNGNLGSPNIITMSRETRENGKFNTYKLPFYKSEYYNGTISFYILKDNLPNYLNAIKQYDSLTDYYLTKRNEYANYHSDLNSINIEYITDDNEEIIGYTEKESENNVYKNIATYIESNISEIVNDKLKEIFFAVKPNFNFLFDAGEFKDRYIDEKTEIYHLTNGKEFYIANLEGVEALSFNREFYNNLAIDYAKLILINPGTMKFKAISYTGKEDRIELGSGYLNIQQAITLSKDNLTTNLSSLDFNIDKITITDKNSKDSNGDYNTIKYDLSTIELKKNNLEESSEKVLSYKRRGNYNISKRRGNELYESIQAPLLNDEFKTAIEDKEITITHSTEYKVGATKDLEYGCGYADLDGYINLTDIPSYKLTIIKPNSTYGYLLDVTELSKKTNVYTIKQLQVIDYDSGEKYTFQVEKVLKQNNKSYKNVLEFDTNIENDDYNYINGNEIITNILQGLSSGYYATTTKPSNNEITIVSDNTGNTFVNGNTIILGKEYFIDDENNSIILSKISNNDEYAYYSLTINIDGNIITQKVQETSNKMLVLRCSSEVEEYLQSIPNYNIEHNVEGKIVYISNYMQREGNALLGNFNLEDLENINGHFDDSETIKIPCYIGSFGQEVNIEYVSENTVIIKKE